MPRPPSRIAKIPEMTVRRLSIYSRCLAQLDEDGVKTISSQELAERFHLNSAQVRKDLAYFGEFGIRGIGYYVANLRAELSRLLGLDREWRVVLVGFGNLGSALFHYRGFARQGFRIGAIVDDDPAKAGRRVSGLEILPLAELPRVVKQEGIQIGVIAVPGEAAQPVADRLVVAGVRAILNFAPARLKVPKEVRLQNVDLSIELENLSFHLAQTTR
jgi:redox-sensing transcriptional repressor